MQLDPAQCRLSDVVEPTHIRNPRIILSDAHLPSATALWLGSPNDARFVPVGNVSGDCPAGYTLCGETATGRNYRGYRCIRPVAPAECPTNPELARCDYAAPGELCEGDHECGTSQMLNNCGDRYGNHDVYHTAAPTRSHALVLAELSVPCTLPGRALHDGDAFMRLHDGTVYRHDVRLHLASNTLASPADRAGVLEHSRGSCPAVAKTFLNGHTCVRHHACAQLEVGDATLELNASTLRRFHAAGNQHVLAVEGLRLETSTYLKSPCTNKASRWKRLGRVVVGGAGAGGGGAGPVLPPMGSLTDPSQCEPGRCCGVLLRGAPGAQCEPVPIWDFTGWAHPGGSYVLASRLCGQVRYNWLGRSSTHASMQDPEAMGAQALAYGATQVGAYTDAACAGGGGAAPPPPPPLTCTNSLDGGTLATIVGALNTSTDANPYVRDVVVKPTSSLTCTVPLSAVSAGLRVLIEGECWQHVHPDEYDVRDVTYFHSMCVPVAASTPTPTPRMLAHMIAPA